MSRDVSGLAHFCKGVVSYMGLCPTLARAFLKCTLCLMIIMVGINFLGHQQSKKKYLKTYETFQVIETQTKEEMIGK